MIYHNSVFTNDVRALGYDSMFDKIRSFFLGIIERILFKKVDSFVLLDPIKKRIENLIGKTRIKVLNSRYLETVITIYIHE